MVYKLSDFQPVIEGSGNAEPSALYRLPSEIRIHIYEHLLPGPLFVLSRRQHEESGQDLYGKTWESVKSSFIGYDIYHTSSQTQLIDLRFLRTSRQIYFEAAPLFYSKCIFNITVRWDGAHLLASSIEHAYPAHFQPWPAKAAQFMRKLHIDIPILSKRTWDRQGYMFEAYTDIRRNLRLLIDHLHDVDLQELTVDCFYLACYAEEKEIPSDRLVCGVKETLYALRSLQGLRKATFQLHILDHLKKVLYQVNSSSGEGILLSIREMFSEIQAEMTGDTATIVPAPLTTEWAALDQSVMKAKHVLLEDNRLERLNSKSTFESDKSRRSLQLTLDQAWSAADLGDEAEFAEARRAVYAALRQLAEDVDQDFDNHQRQVEEDRKRINDCFADVISDLTTMALEDTKEH